jgi:hypothetical protein
METSFQNRITEKQSYETDIEYRLFVQFVLSGSIKQVLSSNFCKVSEKQLLYLAKQNHWKDRNKLAQKDTILFIIESNLESLLRINTRDFENAIACSEKMSNMMEALIEHLPSNMAGISQTVSKEPMKILRYVNRVNQFIRSYYSIKKTLNSVIESYGVNLKDLDPIIDSINFGEKYKNIENEFTESEKLTFNQDLENTIKNTFKNLYQQDEQIANIPIPKLEIKEKEITNSNPDNVDIDKLLKQMRKEDDIFVAKRNAEIDRKARAEKQQKT